MYSYVGLYLSPSAYSKRVLGRRKVIKKKKKSEDELNALREARGKPRKVFLKPASNVYTT